MEDKNIIRQAAKSAESAESAGQENVQVDRAESADEKSHICEAADITEEKDLIDLYNLSELYKVFADFTRVRILSALTDGEMCVYHLAEALEMGQSAVSHQLRVLRASGLVRPRRDGRTVYYALDDEHVNEILEAGLEHVIHKRKGL